MGRGGCRYGAGRPGWRVKAEHCYAIDVRRFASFKMLAPGFRAWQWSDPDTGKQLASIGVEGGADGLVLLYSRSGQARSEPVRLTYSACGFGGRRPWFHCPRCGRRVAKLFLRVSGFACRHCHGLTYASRCADEVGRSWRKQRKIEAKLGELGAKPKRMHWDTYARLLAVIEDCQARRDAALVAAFSRFMVGRR